MGPMSYEGTENYIFVSYAHKDSPRVLQVLEKLTEKGYRIWYDDGIAAGTEWPEYIARHLDGCAAFLTFVSPNFMESEHCKRELTYAQSLKKPVMAVFLEPTELTSGVKMQLAAHHCVYRYNYAEEKDFLRKLFSGPALVVCNENGLQPQIPWEQENPNPTPKPKRSIVEKLVLSLLLLALLAGGAYGGKLLWDSYVTILPDVRASKYTASLSLEEQVITGEVIEKLQQLEQLETLFLYDCTLEEGALDTLQSATLSAFYAENTPIANLTFLNNCPSVYSLTLKSCGITNKSFEGVDTGRITALNLEGNQDFTDLSVAKSPKLLSINVAGTGVADISPLENLTMLTVVNCNNTKVTKIDALAGLENLAELHFVSCPITKVSTPFVSRQIKIIEMGDCGLKNLAGFEELTGLQRVYLHGNKLKNVDWLANSVNTLTDLNLGGNPLTKESIAFLQDANALIYLELSDISLGDTALLENLTGIEYLVLRNCNISDLSHLAKLENLNHLFLSNNKLTDLSGLPVFRAVGNSTLDLAYNKIESIAPIAGKRFGVLALQGNPLQFAEGDFEDVGGELLTLEYHESLLESGKVSFDRVYVTGCPVGQQLALENEVGYGLACVTETVMRKALEQKELYYPEE